MQNTEALLILENAIKRLAEALKIDPKTTPIAVDAVIQRFEFCHELFWKTLKKLLLEENIDVQSPKQVLQQAYALGWIKNEDLWLQMSQDRNLTSHTYQEKLALEIYQQIPVYLKEMQTVYSDLIKRFLQQRHN